MNGSKAFASYYIPLQSPLPREMYVIQTHMTLLPPSWWIPSGHYQYASIHWKMITVLIQFSTRMVDILFYIWILYFISNCWCYHYSKAILITCKAVTSHHICFSFLESASGKKALINSIGQFKQAHVSLNGLVYSLVCCIGYNEV